MSYEELPNKALLRPEEVTDFLRISRRSVYRLHEEGAIEGIKIKNSLRLFRDSVVEYIERQKEKEE